MNSRFVKRTGKLVGGVLGILFAIFVFALACGLSWILTCGIIKLITMCFGWTFSWLTSTGIWLIAFLLRSTFNYTVKVKEK